MQGNNNAQQINNPMQLLSGLRQLQANLNGRNPDDAIRELINSGKMSQDTYNQLKQRAEQLAPMLQMFMR